MMIDFAIESEQRAATRRREQAILEAASVRFRPIMMTTMAALMGALPIAVGWGAGAATRRPLGVAVVGGLAFSQLVTLYVTPVFYTYLDELQTWFEKSAERRRARKHTGEREVPRRIRAPPPPATERGPGPLQPGLRPRAVAGRDPLAAIRRRTGRHPLGGAEQHRFELRRRQRPREVEPLPQIAPELLESGELLRHLDALRDRAHGECRAEGDHGLRERAADSCRSLLPSLRPRTAWRS